MVPQSIKHKTIRLIFIYLIMATSLSFNFAANAAGPKRVALLPFKINAEKDMTFMQNGIFDMLASRLALEGEVVVIGRQEAENAFKAAGSPDPVNESVARQIGSSLNADYTLFGSVTVFGKSISIDAKMVDVSAKTPTASFFDQSEDLGGIITKINQIATKINAGVFGRQAEVARKEAPAAKPAPADELHEHPEKLLKKGGAEGEGSPFIMTTEEDKDEREAFQKFWRSASFRHLINGIAMGDVDRDGKIETVVVTPDDVIVYRAEGGKFYTAHEIKDEISRYPIGVDVADINGNGFPEIFVTSLAASRRTVDSVVFEYDGQAFQKIVDGSSWYYRVCDVPNRGKILLGQKHRVAQPYSGRVYEMIWQNSDYVPEIEIKTPREIQVMGFSLGDILNDKQEVAAAYGRDDRIEIIDANGKEMWKSSEPYGGSTLYILGEKEDRMQVRNFIYYPMRLLVTDADGDGKSELVVVKNHEISGRHLEQFRKFTNADVESMSWDGLGLQTRWRTRKISGFIRDYMLGDFDNDGKIELVAAVIMSEGSAVLVSEPKSTIIAYELPG
ncbi:MAG: VCBS repeat-containing protein [Deltaproteobacteria bacterium]